MSGKHWNSTYFLSATLITSVTEDFCKMMGLSDFAHTVRNQLMQTLLYKEQVPPYFPPLEPLHKVRRSLVIEQV